MCTRLWKAGVSSGQKSENRQGKLVDIYPTAHFFYGWVIVESERVCQMPDVQEESKNTALVVKRCLRTGAWWTPIMPAATVGGLSCGKGKIEHVGEKTGKKTAVYYVQ